MTGAGGATSRMKPVLRCSILFVGGMVYSMAWHDVLANLFLGWEDAWIATSGFVAVGCIFLCRRLLANRGSDTEP
jgi:hypothetical protein